MKFNRRLLELSGIMRRSDKLILEEEGDEEEEDAGDDLFGDEGDDEAAEGDEGGESGGEETREPPESLDSQDVEEFGSPRFKEIDDFLATAFDESTKSAYVGAQELESYPGENLETPAKEESEEPEEKSESFLRHRDKDLILEARRLLAEAEAEGAAADDFDMEHFARRVKHLINNYTTIIDIEGSIFNMARQMILNNFGPDTENEFIEFIARLDKKNLDFTDQFQDDIQPPAAVGAIAGGGGGA
jgi:hypothetical protein